MAAAKKEDMLVPNGRKVYKKKIHTGARIKKKKKKNLSSKNKKQKKNRNSNT